MKKTRVVVSPIEAFNIALQLISASKWFEMTPLPDDEYEFVVKDEPGLLEPEKWQPRDDRSKARDALSIHQGMRPESPVTSRKLKPRGLQLLEEAPVSWDKLVSDMPMADRQEAERFLSDVAQRAARLIGYLGARGNNGCGDAGHADAVEASNREVAKVRRALGFTQPKHDINF